MSAVAAASAVTDLLDGGRDALDAAGLRLTFEGGEQRLVGDVVAEGVEADLAGIEDHLRRANDSLRRIDDADRLERRRQRGEARPDADLVEERDRPGEQRRRPLIGRSPGAGRRARRRSPSLEEECGGEADWARADDGDVADLGHLLALTPPIAGRALDNIAPTITAPPGDDPGVGSGRREGRARCSKRILLSCRCPMVPHRAPGKQFAGLLASAGRIGESMG